MIEDDGFLLTVLDRSSKVECIKTLKNLKLHA